MMTDEDKKAVEIDLANLIQAQVQAAVERIFKNFSEELVSDQN